MPMGVWQVVPDQEYPVGQDRLLRLALKLPEHWRIADAKLTDFDPEVVARDRSLTRYRGRLDVVLETVAGQLPCPECGKPAGRYDSRPLQTWEHLGLFDYRTYLHAAPVRVDCEEHGVRTVAMPWARPGSGFTLEYELRVLDRARETPVHSLARSLGVSDHRLWRVVHHWASILRRQVSMQNVRRIGIDEKSSRRGHKYVTIVVDLDTRKVIFATQGRQSSVLTEFCTALEAAGGRRENITQVTMDMSAAFRAGVERELPTAQIVFHVVKLANDAVDEVRRQEQKEVQELKGSRYVWLHNPDSLSRRQQAQMAELLHTPLKTARAYSLRLQLQEFYETIPSEDALKAWYSRAIRSRLDPIKTVARTIKRHWQGVLLGAATRRARRRQQRRPGRQVPRPRLPSRAEPDQYDLPALLPA